MVASVLFMNYLLTKKMSSPMIARDTNKTTDMHTKIGKKKKIGEECETIAPPLPITHFKPNEG